MFLAREVKCPKNVPREREISAKQPFWRQIPRELRTSNSIFPHEKISAFKF